MANNKPLVDRSGQQNREPVIKVTLPCGFMVEFWLIGLTDKEYIQRAKTIKELETKQDEV
jgi:hypothetical protein